MGGSAYYDWAIVFLEAESAGEFFDELFSRVTLIGDEVDFVEDNQFVFISKYGGVFVEFLSDGVVVFDGVGLVHREDVEEVDENACALDVFEECVAEPRAVGGAFDEAGDVGDDESAVGVEFDDAELGLEGGEGEVGNHRSCF